MNGEWHEYENQFRYLALISFNQQQIWMKWSVLHFQCALRS